MKLSTINILLGFFGLALIVSVPQNPDWVRQGFPVKLWITWSWYARRMTKERGYWVKELS